MLLICTDLDRTLIPNGPQPESAGARDYFERLCEHQDVQLTYVSGRDRSLVLRAIDDYSLPQPDYVIGDVGTSLYQIQEPSSWVALRVWEDEIREGWNGYSHEDLSQLFSDWHDLRLQEAAKQHRYKLSFYVDPGHDHRRLLDSMKHKLDGIGVRYNLVWSVDETSGVGLLDLLPAGAGKYRAIDFLRRRLGYSEAETLFCGDSGNDLDVLASPIPSVLVANALPEVEEEARRLVNERGLTHTFYSAQGGFLGMNGHYCAGILEGLAHFHPKYTARFAEYENGC
jgi:sucrose-6F-phosphate phosphohydrolase